MSLLYSQTANATVTGGTNSIAISGMDLSAVVAGMTIHLGARDRVKGDGLIISTIAPTGSSGGTIKTVGNVDSAFTSAPFVIDTRDYNGTASNYALSALSQVLNALLKLTSPLTTLFAGSRILALDKDTPSAVSRLLYAIAGRPWGALEQRTVTFTPTGASAPTTIEALSVRAFPDGSTPAEAITIDLTTGGADVQATLTGMTVASVLDLASAPIARVAVYGTGTISSFGAGRNKVRDLIFISAGVTLKHSDSLSLPSLADIVTQSGDTLRAMSDSAGNWRVHSYQRIDGRALTIDPDLEAIAALTTQPYGRGLLTESSASGVRGNIGVNQTAGFASESSANDFQTNGSFFNALAIDFTAAGTKMLGYGAIDFTNQSGKATDVQARLLLVNMSAGGVTVATGRKQLITLPPDVYTGSGNLNPMLQVNGLLLGQTYRLQLQIMRVQANGPVQMIDIHIGGLSL